MLDAMAERMELAEALEVTPDELNRRSRYMQAHNPYTDEVPEITCPYHGECGDCYNSSCIERS